MSRVSSRIVLYSKATLPCWGLSVFELLQFSYSRYLFYHQRLCATIYISTGKQKVILVARKCSAVRCDRQIGPSRTEQPLPLPHHPATAPAALLRIMRSSDQRATLTTPSRPPFIPTLSICPTVKTDTFYGPWHLAVGSAGARARNSGEGRAPHQYSQVSIWKCVFCIRPCDTCCLQSVVSLGGSNMLPFSLDT